MQQSRCSVYAKNWRKFGRPLHCHTFTGEFHELLSEYENYVEWAKKSMTEEEKELSTRLLEKLHEAYSTHVCIDAPDKEEGKR